MKLPDHDQIVEQTKTQGKVTGEPRKKPKPRSSKIARAPGWCSPERPCDWSLCKNC